VKEISKLKNVNIAIVGINFDNEFKRTISKILSFNKSCYLDHDKLEVLRRNMYKSGIVQNETSFSFEKYNK